MAYFLINKKTDSTIIVIDNTTMGNLLGVHRHTVKNWFKSGAKQKETENYTVIKADEYYPTPKSSGNRDSMNTRKEKKDLKEGINRDEW